MGRILTFWPHAEMLQEDDLKLDGMFNRMAIVFHPNRVGRGAFQFVHQSRVSPSFVRREFESSCG